MCVKFDISMFVCVCTAGQGVNYISDFEFPFKNSESHWLRNNVPVSIYIIGYQVAERDVSTVPLRLLFIVYTFLST